MLDWFPLDFLHGFLKENGNLFSSGWTNILSNCSLGFIANFWAIFVWALATPERWIALAQARTVQRSRWVLPCARTLRPPKPSSQRFAAYFYSFEFVIDFELLLATAKLLWRYLWDSRDQGPVSCHCAQKTGFELGWMATTSDKNSLTTDPGRSLLSIT